MGKAEQEQGSGEGKVGHRRAGQEGMNQQLITLPNEFAGSFSSSFSLPNFPSQRVILSPSPGMEGKQVAKPLGL